MTKLLFVRRPQVYLPEVQAYKAYLVKHFPMIEVFESTDLDGYKAGDYDVVWHFMGLDFKGGGNYTVHEYNSLSTPPLARLKNKVKKLVNAKPDRRVFLNQRVSEAFGFKDGVPAFHRDMGVDEMFYNVERGEPDYDFICVGGLNRGPIIEKMIAHIADQMDGATILLVGDTPDGLQDRFIGNVGVSFCGRVDYADVPALMARARYGLNIMPDVKPFNVQTSTKVLEYAAVGLPIISTDYPWIRSFEEQYGARCFKMLPDLSNLTCENLDSFGFVTPDMQGLGWENIIEESQVFDFLR